MAILLTPPSPVVIRRFDARTLTSYDSGSLSYSVDRGRFHFIHVHYYPSYHSYKVGLQNCLAWVYGDIKEARERGQKIVLVAHSAAYLSWDEDEAAFVAAGECVLCVCVCVCELRDV